MLGQLDFGLGVGRGIFATAYRLELGFFPQAGGVGCRFFHQSGGVFFRALADLGAGLACRGQNSGSLLAEKRGHDVFVEHAGGRHAPRLHGFEFTFEETLALLQPGQFGRHHPQEVANLGLVVSAAGNGE